MAGSWWQPTFLPRSSQEEPHAKGNGNQIWATVFMFKQNIQPDLVEGDTWRHLPSYRAPQTFLPSPNNLGWPASGLTAHP